MIHDTFTIRKASPKDRPMIQDFFDQMSGESRAFFNRNDSNRNAALRYLDTEPEDKIYFVMTDETIVAGIVFLFKADKAVPWLGIAVREEYKGMHLGRRLMEHAREYALANGKGGILLTTHPSNLRGQALYERVGYERLGVHTSGEWLYLLRL